MFLNTSSWSQGVLDSAQKVHVSLTRLVWLFISRGVNAIFVGNSRCIDVKNASTLDLIEVGHTQCAQI